MSANGLKNWNTPLRLSDLSPSRTHHFNLEPDAEQMAALGESFDLSSLKKVRFSGELRPVGKHDWTLVATLGATIIQPCVATLEPVTTRLDEPVKRSYLADYVEPTSEEEDEGEFEMDADDTQEAIPAELSLSDVAEEALALLIPAYPRATEVALEKTQFTKAGTEAMTDEDAKPFAGLKALRDKLGKDD